MKIKKIALLGILVLVLFFSMTACGNGTDSAKDQQTADQQTADQQATDQQGTELQESAVQIIPQADSSSTVDGLVGSWIDISDSNNFANIAKTDTGYQYEDNEGKYSATFKDGVMKVQVSDSETANAYIDPKSGHMFLVYQDNTTEFKKK